LRIRRALNLPESPEDFKVAQRTLAADVRLRGAPDPAPLVAGVDVAYSKVGPDMAYAVAVVMEAASRRIVEIATWSGPPKYQYVPGLFALREGACLYRVLERLKARPDVLFIDGQGIAHPRGFGLACQIGLTFDLTTVGVAKKRLIGVHTTPGNKPGRWTALKREDGTMIGGVLRTCAGVKPVFVSPGHRCSVQAAVGLASMMRSEWRIIAPIREADIRTRQLRDEGRIR
jgi:deoxyribonuclease V